jgi:hypothetical protein
MHTESLLDAITGITAPQRKRLLAWMLHRPESAIAETFQKSVAHYHRLVHQYPEATRGICRLAAFLVVGREEGWDTREARRYRVAAEKQFHDFDEMLENRASAIKNRRRPPIKRRKVMAYWGVVVTLKQKGNGFRVIAEYLAKTHRLRVSPSYLNRLWKELEDTSLAPGRGDLS